MQIQIHTDHNIEGHEALTDQVSGVVEDGLYRVGYAGLRIISLKAAEIKGF